MKRVWITLGLTLMLMAGGGQGYYGFGTSPACGQPPPYVPPPYYNPYYYPPPANYYNYYGRHMPTLSPSSFIMSYPR